MNKMWVRLSAAFTAVILITMLLVGAVIGYNNRQYFQAADVPPEVQAYFEELRLETQGPPLVNLTTFLVLVGSTAVLAGIWMSRTLMAPLGELEEAAQAIGARQLSERVNVSGTAEIRAVARQFNEMAAELETLETLRRNLLADVAHELRNPLHVLRGNLQAILDDVYPLSKEEVARLLNQTDHLTTLVDDLHELAQAEARQLSLNPQPTDIAALVKETVAAFHPLTKTKQLDLHVELLGTIPTVAVDADRIRQSVSNLISNALRHTPPGGQVVITVTQEAGMLRITVRDSGAGIPAEQLPYVFERFYRTDNARSRDKGGAGLGLAIVRAIAEAHGGSATAVSAGANQGSEFQLHLPLPA